MKKLLTTMAFSALSAISLAQGYLDSFDIRKTTFNSNSIPSGLVGDGHNLYFAANDSLHGGELWAMFGNATAPLRLTDIQPGPTNSIYNSAYPMAVVNGTVFFTGYDTTHGAELWFFNQGGGYGIVKDIREGKLSSAINSPTPFNGKLYFAANDTISGQELWVHDPATNTTEVINLAPGDTGSNPREMYVFNNKLYLQAFDYNSGYEPYEYDPATGTAKMLADMIPGSGSSLAIDFCSCEGKLYFIGRDETVGTEIFMYDGTNPPTAIKDIQTGTAAGVSQIGSLKCFNKKLHFAGYDNGIYELMSYDPATDQTATISQFGTNPNIRNLTVCAGKLFFTGQEAGFGDELYMYDGTNAPSRITDIAPGQLSSSINYLAATTHALYFSARGSEIGQELFRYSPYAKVGVENMRFNGTASVYPNPANEFTTLKLSLKQSQSLNVTLTDMGGRIIYQTGNVLYSAAEHNIKIPLNNLPAGSYMYSVQNKEGVMMSSGKLQKL